MPGPLRNRTVCVLIAPKKIIRKLRRRVFFFPVVVAAAAARCSSTVSTTTGGAATAGAATGCGAFAGWSAFGWVPRMLMPPRVQPPRTPPPPPPQVRNVCLFCFVVCFRRSFVANNENRCRGILRFHVGDVAFLGGGFASRLWSCVVVFRECGSKSRWVEGSVGRRVGIVYPSFQLKKTLF